MQNDTLFVFRLCVSPAEGSPTNTENTLHHGGSEPELLDDVLTTYALVVVAPHGDGRHSFW
jgi:hypothetical protein